MKNRALVQHKYPVFLNGLKTREVWGVGRIWSLVRPIQFKQLVLLSSKQYILQF